MLRVLTGYTPAGVLSIALRGPWGASGRIRRRREQLGSFREESGFLPRTWGRDSHALGLLPQTWEKGSHALGSISQTWEKGSHALGSLPQTWGRNFHVLGFLPQTCGKDFHVCEFFPQTWKTVPPTWKKIPPACGRNPRGLHFFRIERRPVRTRIGFPRSADTGRGARDCRNPGIAKLPFFTI